MGLMKDKMIQQDEQGWSFTDGWVCAKCVNDYALKKAIDADAVTNERCDFCKSSPAAPLDSLLAAFVSGLRTEYGDADSEGVFWDGREGGYQWDPKWSTWDLVDEFDDVLTGGGLLDVVRKSIHDRVWVDVNFAHPSEDEALSWSWDRFREAVLYETRYVFWLRKDEDEEQMRSWGEIPAARILDELGALIVRLGLVRELSAGYRICRGRPHRDGSATWRAVDLGTVPASKANRANRMSPAGIPMFYGSTDLETTVQEVGATTDLDRATCGWFETSASVSVVDFTSLPTIPSMFDLERTNLRRSLIFLHSFVKDLSKRPRPTFEEIDYVPTQIVTEYLLKVFGDGTLVQGLLFASSFTQGTCVVLDVGNEACVDTGEGWKDHESLRLGLDPSSIETVTLPKRPGQFGRRIVAGLRRLPNPFQPKHYVPKG